ncbi:MAG: lamin tail domain-containing protein [Chthoniobacteraceae bacterium]
MISKFIPIALIVLMAGAAASAQVVINEINYDPADHTRATEFIELHNPGAQPVDVSGWRIEDAVTFVFPNGVTIPAGGFFVVAENAAAFQAQFGSAPGGVFTGTLKNSGERVRLRNGSATVIDQVDYAAGFPWPTAAKGGGSSMELLNPALDNDLGGSWRSSGGGVTPFTPTPGAQNSVFTTNAPPQIRQVAHTPVQPAADVPVTITAKVTDSDGVASVSLEYQVVAPGAYVRKTDAAFTNNWTPVAMHDDGLDGDAVAGDAIYSVVLPASLQTHRALVRYRITVTDTLSANVRVPYADDEQPNFAYFVYNGVPAWRGALRPMPFAGFPATAPQTFPSEVLESIPPYHLIANALNVTNSQYNNSFNDQRFFGTLVYDGVVYDHIQFKNRGIGSTYVSGKNKWAFIFNRARDFRPRDNWGKRYTNDWNSFGMDANASPWAAVNRGSAGVEEALGYRAFELAGMNSLRTHYVHFRVIDAVGESSSNQFVGDLWGLYLALEPMEGNFIDERDLPDGNIYSIEGNGGDLQHQGPTQPTNGSDWNSFRNADAQGGQNVDWYRNNEDLLNLYSFLGVSRLIGNVDVRPGDNYRYYHRPTDNRWLIMPYDLDMMFIAAHHWGGTIDGVVMAGVPNTVRPVTRHLELAIEYRNRCRELLSLLASDASPTGGQIGQLVDEYAQLVNPTGSDLTWADLDAAMWNLNPRTSGGGGATGQSSHKGNFWRALYNDGTRGGLGGTVQTASWIRQLSDPDGDGISDHEGLMQWFVNFATNTYPDTAPPWRRKAASTGGGNDPSTDRQKGFGYKYLEWESLYGRYANATLDPAIPPDLSFPGKPVITYAGPAEFPANALDFDTSAFAPSADGGTTFAAMQWRVGEIRAPGVPGYTPGTPRKYEIEEVWTSPELNAFDASVRVPVGAIEPGHTYRARVRHKDANGRWSYWCDPVQFVASTPDITPYQQSLVVSEIMYHPAPVTQAEFAAGFTAEDFEYLELRNVSATPIDLTDVRFTKGIDFDFAPGTMLAAGASVLVVKNADAFNLRYGSGRPIAGSYGGGSLMNSGEEIKLSYGIGTAIREFTYGDTAPWPTSPDGEGYSLVRRFPENLTLDDNLASNWRASLVTGGSPGGDDRPTYDAWAGMHGVSDPLEDDDRDGISAVAEYRLAGDPEVTSTAPLPTAGVQTVIVDDTPGKYFTLTFRAFTAAEDVTHAVEFSTDLAAWTLPGVLISSVDQGDGTVIETWRSPNPINGTALFGHVRVVKP